MLVKKSKSNELFLNVLRLRKINENFLKVFFKKKKKIQ